MTADHYFPLPTVTGGRKAREREHTSPRVLGWRAASTHPTSPAPTKLARRRPRTISRRAYSHVENRDSPSTGSRRPNWIGTVFPPRACPGACGAWRDRAEHYWTGFPPELPG